MEKSDVTLKNVKTFEGREGIGLNADIFIKGVKCAHVYDSANGGCYSYDDYSFREGNAAKAEKIRLYLKELKSFVLDRIKDEVLLKDKYKEELESTRKFAYDTDMFVDELFNDYETQRIEKKFKAQKLKDQLTCVLIGKPGDNKYQFLRFPTALENITNDILQESINKDIIPKYCKNGVEILNTNLKPRGIVY